MSVGSAARHLKQDVTYWTTSEAEFAGFQFSTPVAIKGRWEERAVLFQTPEGDDAISRAVAYLAADVDIGDYVALGDHTAVADPTTLTGAYRVKQFLKQNDLRNISVERKAFL